jgi:hypothetical protein
MLKTQQSLAPSFDKLRMRPRVLNGSDLKVSLSMEPSISGLDLMVSLSNHGPRPFCGLPSRGLR